MTDPIGWSIEARTPTTSVCVALPSKVNDAPIEVASRFLMVIAFAVARDGADSETLAPSGLSEMPWPSCPVPVQWRTLGPLLVAFVDELGWVSFAGDRDLFGSLLCSAYVGLQDGSAPPAIGMDGGAYEASLMAPGGDA